MTDRLVLLAYGTVRLMVGVGVLARGAVFLCGAQGFFLRKIAGLLSALVDKVRAQLQVFLLAGHFVQAHQRHLGYLMAGIAAALAFLRAKVRVHVIGKAAGSLEQLVLAGGLIIRHRALCQMAEAVQLVIVAQIGPRSVHAVDDVVGIQIAVLRLSGADEVDGFIGDLFQRRIGMLGQGVAYSLDPLGEVGILKQEAIETALFGVGRVFGQGLKTAVHIFGRHVGVAFLAAFLVHFGRGAEVAHAPAGLGVRYTVVEGLPLVGDHLFAHQFHVALPERIGDVNVFKRQRFAEGYFVHKVPPRTCAHQRAMGARSSGVRLSRFATKVAFS